METRHEINCCSIGEDIDVCSVCNTKAQKVGYKTVLMMLKYEHLKSAVEEEYFFCANPKCNVVYFSKTNRAIYYKNDLRIRVGLKETTEPKHICYCFDITEMQIKDEIKSAGKSTIPKFISEKIRNKLCACNIKNPSGKCCLNEINKIIRL